MVEVGDHVLFKSEEAVVKFLGETEFSSGFWVGLELNSPSGKNDGSINGVRYFETKPNHGVFVREGLLELVSNDSRRSSGRSFALEDDRRTSLGGEERLKSIIYKLQDKIKALTDELASLRQSYNELLEKTEQNPKNQNQYDEELEILMIDKETLEEQNELFKQEIQALEEKNKNLLKEIHILKDLKSSGNSADSLIQKNIEFEKIVQNLREHSIQIEQSLNDKINILEPKAKLYESLKLSHDKLQEDYKKTAELAAELQSHIESTTNSSELVDTLTSENIQLQEDKKQLAKQLEELEDLNNIEKELEGMRIENEAELKQQVLELEKLLLEKDETIELLGLKNAELETIKPQKQENNTYNGDKVLHNQLAQAQTEKFELELKLLLLDSELKGKEDLIRTIFESFSEGTFQNFEQRSEIFKYHQLFTSLSQFLTSEITTEADLFTQLTTLELIFNLQLTASLMNYLLTIMNLTAELSREDYSSLRSSTNDVAATIKEQRYGQVDLSAVHSEIHNFVEKLPETSFKYRESLKFELSKQSNSIDALQGIIGFIQGSDAFEKSELEQISLFKALQQHKSVIHEYITQLNNETSGNNEISELENTNKWFNEDVQEFFAYLKGSLTRRDFDNSKISVGSQLTKFVNLIEGFFPISWKSHHIESNITSDKRLIFGDADTKLKELQAQLASKDSNIEELEIKIGIFKSRLTDSKELSDKLKYYKENYESLLEKNNKLSDKLVGLNHELRNKQEQLSKYEVKKYLLLNNDEFGSLILDHKDTSQINLLSKLQVYSNTIKYFTDFEDSRHNNDWLKKTLPIHEPYKYDEWEELKKIGRDLRRSVQNSTNIVITN